MKDPADLAGIELALYGALPGGTGLRVGGLGPASQDLPRARGRFDLPHAQTHATVLPYVLALNAPNATEATTRLAEAFGAETALEGLQQLRRKLGAPRALRDIGLQESDIPAAVEDVLAIAPASNPTPVTKETLTALLCPARCRAPCSTGSTSSSRPGEAVALVGADRRAARPPSPA